MSCHITVGQAVNRKEEYSVLQDERIVTFIRSMDTKNSEVLERIERESVEMGVPIIRPEMQSFLRVFLELVRPARILEVGTGSGFSALLMAEYSGAGCRIVTIEADRRRAAAAACNLAVHPDGEKVRLLEGDAGSILPTLDGTFDFIFMDAAKAQYIHFLPEVLRLLRAGGVLISDNVLQEGDILESHYAVERRNRTIYKRMREYLLTIKTMPELVTSIVPIGDGAAVNVRRDTGMKGLSGSADGETEDRGGAADAVVNVADRSADEAEGKSE